MEQKKVLITIGDPSGCGPIVTVNAVKALVHTKAKFYLVGDLAVLEKISGFSQIKPSIVLIDPQTSNIQDLKFGYPNKLSGQASLNYLNAGLEFIKDQGISRLVTAPVSKEAVCLAKPGFVGHTEFLADWFKVKNVEMIMVGPTIKTVLFTRHVELAKVSGLISSRGLQITLDLVINALKNQFKIKTPKIVLAAVNPHAGVDTFLAKEEKIMVAAAGKYKGSVFGPYPADTIFTPSNLAKYDCVICPYHDQAMIAFKLLAMKQGVNCTLGLPIIRTSPAHGTAFDLIREKKKPFADSMIAAIKLALELKA